MQNRVLYYEYLLMDKIELLQSIELHKHEVAILTEEKLLFMDYLSNAKTLATNNSFQTWALRKKEAKRLVAYSSNVVLNEENGNMKSFK